MTIGVDVADASSSATTLALGACLVLGQIESGEYLLLARGGRDQLFLVLERRADVPTEFLAFALIIRQFFPTAFQPALYALKGLFDRGHRAERVVADVCLVIGLALDQHFGAAIHPLDGKRESADLTDGMGRRERPQRFRQEHERTPGFDAVGVRLLFELEHEPVALRGHPRRQVGSQICHDAFTVLHALDQGFSGGSELGTGYRDAAS